MLNGINYGEFTVTIELGNAAVEDALDVSNALRRVADLIDNGAVSGAILDANGNTVGSFESTPTPCAECQGELDRDCFGDARCPECDGPCPGCYSG